MNELGQEYVAIAILAAGLGTIALLALLIFCTQRVHRTIRQARRDGGNFPVFVVPFSPATAYQLHFRSPDDDDGTPASLPASARAAAESIQLRRYTRFADDDDEAACCSNSSSGRETEMQNIGGPSGATASHNRDYSTGSVRAQQHRIAVNDETKNDHTISLPAPTLAAVPTDSVALALERRSRIREAQATASRASLLVSRSGSQVSGSSPPPPPDSPALAHAHSPALFPAVKPVLKLSREAAEAIASEKIAESSVMLSQASEDHWLDGQRVLDESDPSSSETGSVRQTPESGRLKVIFSQRTQF